MGKKKAPKTNAMRLLDRAGVAYRSSTYATDGNVDALHVASKLGVDPQQIFKTIVLETVGGGAASATDTHVVAVIGADHELDLKKVAAHFGVKKVSLVDWRGLKDLTGYIRGGCSPIGMKRLFPTVIDTSATEQEEIFVSAGEIGAQIVISPRDLAEVIDANFSPIHASHHDLA